MWSYLLAELDKKTEVGLKAKRIQWVVPGESLEVLHEDGSVTGPFMRGQHFGEDADPKLSSEVAKRWFQLGLMRGWAQTALEAHRVICEIDRDQPGASPGGLLFGDTMAMREIVSDLTVDFGG